MASNVRLPVLGVRPAPGERERARIADDLRRLGLADVRFGRAERMLYATEASVYQVEPVGVVVLARPADAAVVVRYCAERGLAILPRGGGTSLNGQAVNEAVILDFSANCRGITALDVEAKRCRVEPGVVLDHLNESLRPHGLMFAPDPNTGSHNNIGGMIGNNSAGAHSILYGRTSEHLIGLDVVMADGAARRLDEGASERDPAVRELTRRIAAVVAPLAAEIRARFPKIVRHVDGYNLDLLLDGFERSTRGTFDRVNLAKLVCGSEGTLCTIVGAELNLVEAPTRTGLAIVGFASVDESLAALGTMLETRPAAIELVDDTIIALARRNTEYARYVTLMPQPTGGAPLGAVMYVEYFGFGSETAELDARFAELRKALPNAPMQWHTDPAAMRQAWTLRRACEPLLHGIPGIRKPIGFVEDTAVDPSRLPKFIHEFKEILARHGTSAAFFAHASVGCLHIRPMLTLKDAEDRERMIEIAEDIADLVARHGGALSGEHGSGRSRTALLERYFGRDLVEAMRQIKAIWDPDNRMNPGNKVGWTREETLVESLRVQPHGATLDVPELDTYFRYEREHGFGSAVEMCNGAGMCRRLSAGTMCPSYQASLDERHSTRGRGNHLRLAMTGQLSHDGASPSWHDPDVYDTLRLCLACKACKTECPSNVDIAKLKSEYLAQRYRRSGLPLEARLFSGVRTLNRLGALAPGLANRVSASRPLRWLAEKSLGIDRRRSLPPFARSALRWMAERESGRARHASASAEAREDSAPRSREGAADPGRSPVVLLFADCFTTYNEPAIAESAVRVLEAFGYGVSFADLGCCGRSQISTGNLEDAKRTCAATARRLIDAIDGEGAVALVALEPSCLSAIKDDWLELSMDVDRANVARLAERSHLVEEFLDAEWDRHPVRPSFRVPAARGTSPREQGHSPESSGGAGTGRRVLLHGHCHQKALWGIETSARMLRRVVGDSLVELKTGCCGMAGSFGFTRDRFDLSMRIAELSLLPAVRAEPEAIVCAPGTSCRHQVHDGASVRAFHPIEIVHDALELEPTRVG